ncbi:MAG: HD domain-containing protein, partial [Lachnospiraceae bacterium]|nr:HD domain-containing protein [Lachnospiraceae bacterium]
YYNRYTDKTQVFSFYKNDDISRRGYHVQLVARIARNIGNVLGLNENLIEAIALGHDIGHTPFGHAGERILNRIYREKTGRYFNHNVHSVRVLDRIFERNISLQTLDGIICHNGEFVQQEYRPKKLKDFEEFDSIVESCYEEKGAIGKLVPSTLEGCVVRICDMIAYIGKDRQDAMQTGLLKDLSSFTQCHIGVTNAEMINNLSVNVIENSYGKDYILMDNQYYEDIKLAKKENYEKIYFNEELNSKYDNIIEPMFWQIYDRLLDDLKNDRKDSVIFRHHLNFVWENEKYYDDEFTYQSGEHNQIVVDYLASMTDDYFIDLYKYLFPKGKYDVEYVTYFDT